LAFDFGAAMPGDIGRRARLRMVLEIGGRSHDCEALVGPQRHGDHVLRHQFNQPHGGVEPIDNNVDQSPFGDECRPSYRDIGADTLTRSAPSAAPHPLMY